MAIERRRFGLIRVLNLDKYSKASKKRKQFGKPVLEVRQEVRPQGKISRNFLRQLQFNRLKVLRLVIEQVYKQKYPGDGCWSKLDEFFVLVRKGRRVLALYWQDVEEVINSLARKMGREIKVKKPKKGGLRKIQIPE